MSEREGVEELKTTLEKVAKFDPTDTISEIDRDFIYVLAENRDFKDSIIRIIREEMDRGS